jgi:transposase InsO family protein
VGAILGAGGTQLGAVTHEGVATFMGVKVPCYVANITKSVVGLGLLTSEFGFEVHIAGKVMSIFATRSGERTAITTNGKYLFNLPLTLFQPLQITSMMTTLNADSLYSLWHHRLAHISDRKLAYMSRQAEYVNRGLVVPAEAAKRIHMEEYCDSCMLGKAHKVKSNKLINREKYLPGRNWSVDLLGKQSTPGIVTNNQYLMVFTDRATRWRFGIGLANNGEAEIIRGAREWVRRYIDRVRYWYAQKEPRIEITLLADNLEFRYRRVQEELAAKDIIQFFTAPRHSSSNGLAERGFGMVRAMARCMLKAKDLPVEFWEAASLHAIYILNRIPFFNNGKFQKDPYQLWYRRVFDYSKLKIFGSRCYVLSAKTDKGFDVMGRMAVYIGHDEDSNAYKCYIPEINDFVSTEDIRFQEAAVDVFEAQRTPTERDSDFHQTERS